MLLLASASLQHGMHFESLLLVYVLICDIFIVYIYFYIAYFYFLEFIGTFFLKIPIFALMFMIKNIKKMQLAGCKAHVCFAWSLLVLFLIFFIWSFFYFFTCLIGYGWSLEFASLFFFQRHLLFMQWFNNWSGCRWFVAITILPHQMLKVYYLHWFQCLVSVHCTLCTFFYVYLKVSLSFCAIRACSLCWLTKCTKGGVLPAYTLISVYWFHIPVY